MQSADVRIRTVLVWNSVIVLNVKAIMNIAWIICTHINMSKKRMQILVITTNRIGMLCALKPYIPICPETFIPVSGT